MTILSWVQMQKKLNICRNWKLQYPRRRSLGDYIQHLFYGLYPMKQTFLFAKIAEKLAETFNY